MPCSDSRKKPTGTSSRAGQMTSPPALLDISLMFHERMNTTHDRYMITIAIGSRKNTVPNTSIQVCARFDSRPATTSMRMCSLRSSVYGEQSRKIAENRYHCVSRKAFELTSNALRTMALTALIRTAASTSQISPRPMRVLRPSIARDRVSRAFMEPPIRRRAQSHRTASRTLAAPWRRARRIIGGFDRPGESGRRALPGGPAQGRVRRRGRPAAAVVAMLECAVNPEFSRRHVPSFAHRCPGRPGALGGHRRREPAPGRPHRADRVGELREPGGDGGAGLAAHEQVRRGLSGQALLRRLRARRCRRAAGDRPGEEALRRRLRQRPAAFGSAGQPGGLPRRAEAGRHDPRHEPAARRTPDARLAGQHQRQVVQRRPLRPPPGDRAHRLRRRRAAGARSTSRSSSSPARRRIRA